MAKESRKIAITWRERAVASAKLGLFAALLLLSASLVIVMSVATFAADRSHSTSNMAGVNKTLPPKTAKDKRTVADQGATHNKSKSAEKNAKKMDQYIRQ